MILHIQWDTSLIADAATEWKIFAPESKYKLL